MDELETQRHHSPVLVVFRDVEVEFRSRGRRGVSLEVRVDPEDAVLQEVKVLLSRKSLGHGGRIQRRLAGPSR